MACRAGKSYVAIGSQCALACRRFESDGDDSDHELVRLLNLRLQRELLSPAGAVLKPVLDPGRRGHQPGERNVVGEQEGQPHHDLLS